MKPLLKNLMGNGKDQETLEAMRLVLQEFQAERERYEALIEGSKAGADRLKKLGEPLAKTEGEVESLNGRLTQVEERFQGLVKMASCSRTSTTVRKAFRRARRGRSPASPARSRARRRSSRRWPSW